MVEDSNMQYYKNDEKVGSSSRPMSTIFVPLALSRSWTRTFNVSSTISIFFLSEGQSGKHQFAAIKPINSFTVKITVLFVREYEELEVDSGSQVPLVANIRTALGI